jgi:hypothetical protein
MENRMGLKILTRLLVVGLAHWNTDNESLSEVKNCADFLSNIERIMNSEILGSPGGLAHWECTTTENKKQIGTISLDNEKMIKIIDKSDKLIDVCITESAEKRQEWKDCLGFYIDGMSRLRQKGDFTDEEIFCFQRTADEFFGRWLDLNGKEGLSNYIHLWGAGHLCDYLFYWRNFYVHSQQGWEAFNNLLKLYYLRRTQRGGVSNKGKGPKDRLKPLAKWMQRKYLYCWGVTVDDAQKYLEEKDMEKNISELMADSEDDEDDFNLFNN